MCVKPLPDLFRALNGLIRHALKDCGRRARAARPFLSDEILAVSVPVTVRLPPIEPLPEILKFAVCVDALWF